MSFTHGHTRGPKHSRIYGSWRHMLERCLCKTSDHYAGYGARGIKVCKRWLKFENFLADMGERPEGKSLDRRNNNGNYTKKNCRWATQREQTQNTRVSKLNPRKVRRIRKLRAQGMPSRKVGKLFGVKHITVLRIEHRKIWSNIA